MRIFSFLILFFLQVSLSGCFWLRNVETVPANLDYATTTYGFLNSGDLKAGTLLLWDSKTDSVYPLSDIPGFVPPPPQTDKEFDFASYVSGADFGLEGGNPALQAKADLLVANRSAFRVAHPNVKTFDDYLTLMTQYLSENIRNGGTLIDEWFFRETYANPDAYYLLVRKVTYGDEIQLVVDDKIKSENKFSIPIRSAELNVQLQGKGLRHLKGSNTEIGFFLTPLRPYWLNTTNPDGSSAQNAAFRPVLKELPRDFSAALRQTSPNKGTN